MTRLGCLLECLLGCWWCLYEWRGLACRALDVSETWSLCLHDHNDSLSGLGWSGSSRPHPGHRVEAGGVLYEVTALLSQPNEQADTRCLVRPFPVRPDSLSPWQPPVSGRALMKLPWALLRDLMSDSLVQSESDDLLSLPSHTGTLTIRQGPSEVQTYKTYRTMRGFSAEDFVLSARLSRGHSGEVWLGHSVKQKHRKFVLKHFHHEGHSASLWSRKREVFFGRLLEKSDSTRDHVARFVTEIHLQDATWLVFEHGGLSLNSYLHDVTENGLEEVSQAWLLLRSQKAAALRPLFKSLLGVMAALHSVGITHRDIKPHNIVLTLNPLHPFHAHLSHTSSFFQPEHTLTREWMDEPLAKIRIIDFGSAMLRWDTSKDSMLYPYQPSLEECSVAYSPPELIFVDEFSDPEMLRPLLASDAYDVYSMGMLMLEIYMGSMNRVLALNAREVARLEASLRKSGVDEYNMIKALQLKALMVYCIYDVDNKCNRTLASKRWRENDILEEGFDEQPALLDLVMRMMRWDPIERITAAQALQHAYFLGP